jgi:hypothetical protein
VMARHGSSCMLQQQLSLLVVCRYQLPNSTPIPL